MDLDPFIRDTLDIYLIDTPDLRGEDITGGETRGSCDLRTKILYMSPQEPSYCSSRADVQALRMLLRDLGQGLQTLYRHFPKIQDINAEYGKLVDSCSDRRQMTAIMICDISRNRDCDQGYRFCKVGTHQSLFSSCAKHCCTIRLDFSEGFSTALLLEGIRHLLAPRTGTFDGILLRDSTSSTGSDCERDSASYLFIEMKNYVL